MPSTTSWRPSAPGTGSSEYIGQTSLMIINHNYYACRFSVSASKWQVEFFKEQPNQVQLMLHK